jgi:hypothetical protein
MTSAPSTASEDFLRLLEANQSLLQQVQKVRRQQRMLFGGLISLVLVGVGGMGYASKEAPRDADFDKVTAKSIVIKDSNGKTRISLSIRDDESTATVQVYTEKDGVISAASINSSQLGRECWKRLRN